MSLTLGTHLPSYKPCINLIKTTLIYIYQPALYMALHHHTHTHKLTQTQNILIVFLHEHNQVEGRKSHRSKAVQCRGAEEGRRTVPEQTLLEKLQKENKGIYIYIL